MIKNIKPKEVLIELKLINIKLENTIYLLPNKKYRKINIKSYHTKLRNIIEKTEEFSNNYRRNNFFELNSDSKNKIIKFQQDKGSIFNDLILLINEISLLNTLIWILQSF